MDIRELSLLEEFGFVGNWWLPDKPDEKIGGKLSYTPKQGLTLTLWGRFPSETNVAGGATSYTYPIILGRTDDGQKLSLLEVLDEDIATDTSNMTTLCKDLYPGFAIPDVLVASLDEFRIHNADIKFYDIDNWSDKPIVTVKQIKASTPEHQYLVTNKQETFVSAEIPKLESRIAFINDCPIGHIASWSRKGLEINTSHFLNLKSKTVQTPHWHIEVIEEIQKLLTFLAGGPMPPLQVIINIWVKENDLYLPPIARDGCSYSTVLLYKPRVPRLKEPDFTWGFLYQFEDLENNFPSIINKFFDREGDFKTAFDLLLLSLEGVSSYLDFQFLPLMQALEAYCRTRRDEIKEIYIPAEEYACFRQRIERALGNQEQTELGKKVKEYLDKANHKMYTFNEQLLYVIQQLPESIRRLFHETPEQFVKQLKGTRDYYTHRGGRQERKALKNEDLHLANLRLWLLITALISLDLGISEKTVTKCLAHSTNYARIRLITEDGRASC